MAGSGRLCNSLMAKTDSGLVAVSKYPPPLTGLALSKNLLGHTMKPITSDVNTSFRLSVYNFLRTFTGPVLAYRGVAA